ncbi:MAG: response regulator [Thermoanaerobaculia bacterium]|jgi:DNA-binding NtrC family response regulator
MLVCMWRELSTERVLIVDDDEIITVALFRELDVAGIAADIAVDPGQARELLEARDYGVVIVDAYMTGQLHERAVGLLDTVLTLCGGARVVLVSAYGSTQLTGRARACDALTIVTKPVSIVVLAKTVERLLAEIRTRPV